MATQSNLSDELSAGSNQVDNLRPKSVKPIGRKAYGSIGHLPNSRLRDDTDFHVNDAQAALVTDKTRDRYDLVIVQEKLDGSNCAVALVNGEVVPLTRKGYHAATSPFYMHHVFAGWVKQNEQRFRNVLREGERLCGEWLAYVHGTKYDLTTREPYAVFDIMTGSERLPFIEFTERVGTNFSKPALLHIGQPISVRKAMEIHQTKNYGCDELEGVVYRMERKGKVDFLAKFVRHDKVDGKYMKDDIWNWEADTALTDLVATVVEANSGLLKSAPTSPQSITIRRDNDN